MTKDQVEMEVVALVQNYVTSFAPKAVDLEDTLSGLGNDSLDNVEITIAIEEKFSIEIPDEEMEKHVIGTSTVQGIADYVTKRVGAS